MEVLVVIISSANNIRVIRSRLVKWAERASRIGKKKNAYKVLAVKPEGKRTLGRHRHK
jgi:hypothetical protein